MELGRGAMGVTYKALGVNLRFAVTLKIINAQGELNAVEVKATIGSLI